MLLLLLLLLLVLPVAARLLGGRLVNGSNDADRRATRSVTRASGPATQFQLGRRRRRHGSIDVGQTASVDVQ